MKYCDEKDKCYGVVGMAVGLNVWEAESLFTSINLDAQGFDCIDFTYEYFFSGAPSVSPKASWEHQIKMFKILMGITLSNVMCRRMVGKHANLQSNEKRELLKMLSEQGLEDYSLSESECEAIFNKSYNYLTRLYSHYQVQEMVEDFANKLAAKRRMSACEVNEALSILNN